MPATALDPALDPVRVEKMIRGAKAAPVSFAFGQGSKPDDSVMAVEKSKSGKALFELVRKEGGAKKGAFGTVQFVDGAARFVCEKDDLTDLHKAVILYFKANKISLKAVVGDAAEAAEAEVEAEETKAEKAPSSAKPEKDDRKDDRKKDAKAAKEEEEEEEDEDEDEDDDIPEGRMFDPKIIATLILKARNKTRSFAYGSSPDLSLLAVHHKLPAVRLAKAVRAEGAKKGSWGTVTRDGGVAVFTCEKNPSSGVKKGLKRWFKEHDLSLRLKVLGPEGEYDDPEDVEVDEAAPPAPPTPEAALAMMAELKARGVAMMPRLKEVARAEPDKAGAIRELLKEFSEVVAGTDLTRARGLLADLNALQATPPAGAEEDEDEGWAEEGEDSPPAPEVTAEEEEADEDAGEDASEDRGEADGQDGGEDGGEDEDEGEESLAREPDVPPAPPERPDQVVQRLKARGVELMPRLKEVARTAPDSAGPIRDLLREFSASIEAGDAGRARELLFELDAIQRAKPSEAERTVATGTIALRKAQMAWQSTRLAARAAIADVHRAALAAVADDPDIDEIAGALSVLMDRREELDEGLDDVLLAMVNSDDDAERAKLKAEAVGIIDGYLDLVGTDPTFAAVDENPFVKTTAKADLTKALGALKVQLAA